MIKKVLLTLAMAVMVFSMFIPLASATTYDISVTADGDKVHSHNWYYGGSDWWWDVGANPNIVYHSYEPGWGNTSSTELSFDISSFAAPAANILSASLNINVLNVWTSGRDDIGALGGSGASGIVYNSGGAGMKSFDVTDGFINLLNNQSAAANYTFIYTGYSGFTFGSAEGQSPAFLRITTADVGDPIPEPSTMILFSSGLLSLIWLRKRTK
jgi:hypothetical protein